MSPVCTEEEPKLITLEVILTIGLVMDAAIAAQNALQYVFEAKSGEHMVIFCDYEKIEIGKAFEAGARKLGVNVLLIVFKTETQTCRNELPKDIMPYLTTDRPDIYINLLRGVREETPFRIKLIHMESGEIKTRLGHCPGVTIDMLTDGALALTGEEHCQLQVFANSLMEKLEAAVKVEISTRAGTKLSLSVRGRQWITDTKLDWKLMKWMNLPTGEVYIAPVEESMEGKLVCDAAMGGIGLLKTPVTVKVKGGTVDAVTSADADTLRRVQNSLHTDAMARVVGEFAFGINPKARFIEEFLETEKVCGTVHIAFGDNTDFPGGKNNSANHMDLMMNKPTVRVTLEDNSVLPVLVNGIYQNIQCSEADEKLPISSVYKVIEYTTLFKTDRWWEAVVVFETYGKPQLGLYLWQKRDGVWKRKNKFSVHNLEEWDKLKAIVEYLAPKLKNGPQK